MTTKSSTFTETENPLSTSWTSGSTNGCRAAGAGAYASAVGLNTSFWKTSNYTFNADHSSQVTLGSIGANDRGGVVVRWASTGGGVGYALFYESGVLYCNRYSGGVNQGGVASRVQAVANGDTIKLGVVGTTFTIYLNGAAVGATFTDANVASGQPGIYYDYGNTNVTRITAWSGIDAVSPGPTITSVSTATPREGASLTITGTAFGASQGSGDVKINGVAQTVTSWSDTSIAVTIVLGTNKFGAAYTVVVRDNALTASNSYAGITGLLPANSGLSYVDIGTPNTTAAYRITAAGDLASGDQLEYENVGGLVTVATDGTFTVGPGVSSFSCRLWSTGVGYGTSGMQGTGGLPGDRRYLKLSPNIKLGW